MKSLQVLALLALTSSAPATEDLGSPIDLCNFNLYFADEFDDLSVNPWKLDGKRWIAHTPWNGDFGDARFRDPGPDSPFAIEHGKLVITASRDEKGRWNSGLLAAGDSTGTGSGLQYGYFEARMNFPPGPGTWPAFWLISLKPTSNKDPKIEIDVIEYYGHRTDRYHAVWHVWPLRKGDVEYRSDGTRIPVPSGSLVSRFNTYGVEITPQTMTYYFNRKPVARFPTPPEHKFPLHPLVNLALGSGYSVENTPDPSRMLVDYVRVYSRKPESEHKHC